MISQFQNIIFALLKVARGSSLEQHNPRTHNNINRIEFRPATQFAYFMRFFYCAVVFLVQPDGIGSHHPKTSVDNPPYRGRKSASNDVRLSTGDLHVYLNTAVWAKIVRELRDYRTEWLNRKKGHFLHLNPISLKAKTLHAGKQCLYSKL